jgi:hypothetical protein
LTTRRGVNVANHQEETTNYLSEPSRVGPISTTGNDGWSLGCVSKRENQATTYAGSIWSSYFQTTLAWHRWLCQTPSSQHDATECTSFGPNIGQLSFSAIKTVTDAAASRFVAPAGKRNEQEDCMNEPRVTRRCMAFPRVRAASPRHTAWVSLADNDRASQGSRRSNQPPSLDTARKTGVFRRRYSLISIS